MGASLGQSRGINYICSNRGHRREELTASGWCLAWVSEHGRQGQESPSQGCHHLPGGCIRAVLLGTGPSPCLVLGCWAWCFPESLWGALSMSLTILHFRFQVKGLFNSRSSCLSLPRCWECTTTLGSTEYFITVSDLPGTI